MPRAGLSTTEVVVAGARLADESGLGSVSLAALADRLGVKAPALYKHVDGIGDLQRRIATLAMSEMGDAVRDALQGKSGADAVAALFTALRSYVDRHPGRYGATTAMPFLGDGDPFLVAATRLIDSIRAALSGYGIPAAQLDHAIRTMRCMIHGYAMLRAADAFQWDGDLDDSVDWMIRFVDAGMSAVGSATRSLPSRGIGPS
ncbi:AcrR family transcriptional regulator [Rhodococcus sp. 27YEA15]|uniref:TetR/AcrR family transcriptional regulator n=1 Tax=Rhodococcus sp. 27YEA15 TaxID=3156259 RepID=UPI003C7C5E36